MTPLARYLTSWKHLAASALGLLGVGLVVAGHVGPQGLIVPLAFYVGAALAVPGTPAISRYDFDPRRVQQAMADEIGRVSGRVPPEVIARIQRIEITLRTQILPRLECLPVGSPELFLVERTACDYVPTAVDAYLRLPGGYVSSQPGTRGRKAIDVLLDELDFLDAEMRLVAAVIHRIDMDRLLAHERFLAERFRREDASAGVG